MLPLLFLAAVTAAPTAASITIHADQPGLEIPADFVGLSCEKKILSHDCFAPKNTSLLNLCRNLSPAVLRIGGNEVESTFWSLSEATPLESMQKNKYTLEAKTIGPASVDAVFAFAKASQWRVIYGLNLGTYNPAMAADEADYALKVGGPQLLALEIGNEPNLYPKGPNRPGIRPSSYGYPQYKEQFGGTLDAILAKHPQAPITGPAITKSTKWMPLFMADFHDRIMLATSHVYPLSAKEADPKAPRFTSVEKLLGEKYPDDWQIKLADAKARGVPYRIGECNTASSGGKHGVSDSFASTLWSIDFMFDVAELGGAGINLHGGFNPGNYSPIIFNKKTSGFEPAAIYYGLLFFRHAGQGRLVPVECKSTANLIAHATRGADQKLRVTIVNKDLTQTVSIDLSAGVTYAKATIQRLTAPSATATTDITFAGAAVGADGSWTVRTSELLTVAAGKATLTLPAASAALVILE